MPCACRVPAPDFPTNSSWGPILWKILHGLAEKYGMLVSKMYEKDQQLTWPRFIEQTLKILPCEECREHYEIYLRQNNPSVLKNLVPADAATWIQNFFFKLHNEVNERNEKPVFDFANLHETYMNVNFQYEIKHFEALLKIVFKYNEVTLISWMNWVRSLRALMSIYGL
jgi:hypothetical protein